MNHRDLDPVHFNAPFGSLKHQCGKGSPKDPMIEIYGCGSKLNRRANRRFWFPCFHLPEQAILESRSFEPQPYIRRTPGCMLRRSPLACRTRSLTAENIKSVRASGCFEGASSISLEANKENTSPLFSGGGHTSSLFFFCLGGGGLVLTHTHRYLLTQTLQLGVFLMLGCLNILMWRRVFHLRTPFLGS